MYLSNTYATDQASWTWLDGDYRGRDGETVVVQRSSPDPVSLPKPKPIHDKWRIEPETEVPFKKVKQDRLIKMTPLSVGERKVSYPISSRTRNIWWYGWPCATANDQRYCFDPQYVHVEYQEFSDYFRLLEAGVPHYSFDTSLARYDNVKNDVMGRAVSDLASTFDLLTEKKEFPETLKMIVSFFNLLKEPIESIKSLQRRYSRARRKGKTHQEIIGDLSGEWLQLRYGIMPLVYTCMDLVELLDQKSAEFKTGRSRDVIHLSENTKPLEILRPDSYIYDEVVGSYRFSAVGKARFLDDNLRLVDQITINPFLTAWELVPFSFVIDWFVNVGEMISSHTSALLSLAVTRKYCVSVKRDLSIRSKWSCVYTDSFTRSETSDPGGRPAHTKTFSKTFNIDELVKVESWRTYDRSLFSPTDVELSFNPSLSWMRVVDSLSLTLKQALRRLR